MLSRTEPDNVIPALHDEVTSAGLLRYAAGGFDRTGRPDGLSGSSSTGGTSRTLVLLHPWFGSWLSWLPLVDRLDERPWLAPDFYSLARSRATATPEVLAEAVGALLDKHGLDTVDVVGNSVGGIVAQIVAAVAPDRVRTLTLVGTGARTAGTLREFKAVVDAWVAAAAHNSTIEADAAVARVVDMLTKYRAPAHIRDGTVDLVTATPRQYIASVLSGARELDLRPRLSRITAPTLVVRGAGDCARTPVHVAELLEGLPNAQAVEISDAGHSPMVDAPDEFAALLLRHLMYAMSTTGGAL